MRNELDRRIDEYGNERRRIQSHDLTEQTNNSQQAHRTATTLTVKRDEGDNPTRNVSNSSSKRVATQCEFLRQKQKLALSWPIKDCALLPSVHKSPTKNTKRNNRRHLYFRDNDELNNWTNVVPLGGESNSTIVSYCC